MNKKKLEVGQVVRLNSGGPDMVVVSIENEVALCVWVIDSGVATHIFPLACLTFQREK